MIERLIPQVGMVVLFAVALYPQTPGSNHQGVASWGVLTTFAATTSNDSRFRAARNALFDGWSGEAVLSDGSQPHQLNYPPFVELLDLIPVQLADIVAVGKVTGGRAYVSSDGTTIYTEFQFQVSQVLTHGGTASVSPGATVPVLRAGGVVRMPSGSTLIRGCPYSALPVLQRQYLFLLGNAPSAEAFRLVAAYDMSGSVYLLDSVTRASGAFTLGEYGKSDSAFLQDVIAAVSKAGK